MSQGIKMDTLILYHGSPNKIVTPVFGGGDDKHDYGRGFYLTENIDLAKEWAVCRPTKHCEHVLKSQQKHLGHAQGSGIVNAVFAECSLLAHFFPPVS